MYIFKGFVFVCIFIYIMYYLLELKKHALNLVMQKARRKKAKLDRIKKKLSIKDVARFHSSSSESSESSDSSDSEDSAASEDSKESKSKITRPSETFKFETWKSAWQN